MLSPFRQARLQNGGVTLDYTVTAQKMAGFIVTAEILIARLLSSVAVLCCPTYLALLGSHLWIPLTGETGGS
jgi:hypothetical protein